MEGFSALESPWTVSFILKSNSVEDMLPPERFMRIHRSFIIGLSHISSVTPQADVKVGDALLHVSEGYRPAFDQYLGSLS